MSRNLRQSAAWYLCRKLSMRPSDGRGLPPGVVTAIAGVALSVAIMLTSMAVVYGFKYSIVKKLTGFHAQITLTAPETADTGMTEGLRLTDSLTSLISDVCGPGHTANLVLMQPAVLKTDSAFQGLMLKGIEYHPSAWQFVEQNLVAGRIPEPTDSTFNEVVLSSATARALSVKEGDRIMAHFIENESLRSRRLDITGIYDSHFGDYDAAIAFTPISMLQRLNKVDSITGTSIELRGLDADQIDAAARNITAELFNVSIENSSNPMYYTVGTLRDKCGLYINWLDLLDTNVVVIVILMALVAASTLISSLFIIILQRVNTIGLLKALGATDSLIRRTFILMSQRLVVSGLLIGNALALLFIFVQDKFHLLPLDPESYYLNYVPVKLSVTAWLAVNIGAVVISALILILPSHIIAKISPAKSIRYE
ncbi:MAG: ABC transporter permease [Muribaculaceae bacterium]|nr:ABC transporter permease [Muribaculaceae bacterium]